MARRRCGVNGRRRACCVCWSGRARACTQRRVYGLWHHLCSSLRVGGRMMVSKKRVRGRSCILRPDSARYHTRISGNCLRSYLFLDVSVSRPRVKPI